MGFENESPQTQRTVVVVGRVILLIRVITHFRKGEWEMRALLLVVCLLASLNHSVAFCGIIVAGTDTPSGSTAVFTIHLDNSIVSGGFTQTIDLSSGAFSIVRQQQTGTTINTEIMGLTFHGTSDAGAVTVRVGSDNGVANATLGQITNVVTATPGSTLVGPSDFVSGDSSFNVYFEVDVAGITLYNKDPHVLVALGITHLPPVGSTHFPPATVNLYLKGGDPNVVVGYAGGTHTIIPEPSSFLLYGLGAVGLLATNFRRRQPSRIHNSEA